MTHTSFDERQQEVVMTREPLFYLTTCTRQSESVCSCSYRDDRRLMSRSFTVNRRINAARLHYSTQRQKYSAWLMDSNVGFDTDCYVRLM